jgi:hypothetical protein
MEDGDDKASSWIYGGKGTCKNVSTPTLIVSIWKGNKECETEGAYISYLGICVWMQFTV